jgi:hypothetical protein
MTENKPAARRANRRFTKTPVEIREDYKGREQGTGNREEGRGNREQGSEIKGQRSGARQQCQGAGNRCQVAGFRCQKGREQGTGLGT